MEMVAGFIQSGSKVGKLWILIARVRFRFATQGLDPSGANHRTPFMWIHQFALVLFIIAQTDPAGDSWSSLTKMNSPQKDQ